MQDAQVQAGRGTRAAGGGAAPGYQPSTTNTNATPRRNPTLDCGPPLPTIGLQPSVPGRPNKLDNRLAGARRSPGPAHQRRATVGQ